MYTYVCFFVDLEKNDGQVNTNKYRNKQMHNGSECGIISSTRQRELPKSVNIGDLQSNYGFYIVTQHRTWIFDCFEAKNAYGWMDAISNVKYFFFGFTHRDWNAIPECEEMDWNDKKKLEWQNKVEQAGKRWMGVNSGFGDWCLARFVSTSKHHSTLSEKEKQLSQTKQLKYLLHISNPEVSPSFQGLLLFDVDHHHLRTHQQKDDLYLHIHAKLHSA
ncbi:hypothetical protein RFI_16531, partial [Reticulomyxa filosa]